MRFRLRLIDVRRDQPAVEYRQRHDAVVRAAKIVRDRLRRIDADEAGRERDLEGRQPLGFRRYDLRVRRRDRALRRLHHGTLREIAGRLRRKPGNVRDVEVRLIRLADQNAERCARALAVAARRVERKLGAVARGAELQHVIGDHAPAFFQRLDRGDVARHPLEAGLQRLLGLRARAADRSTRSTYRKQFVHAPPPRRAATLRSRTRRRARSARRRPQSHAV